MPKRSGKGIAFVIITVALAVALTVTGISLSRFAKRNNQLLAQQRENGIRLDKAEKEIASIRKELNNKNKQLDENERALEEKDAEIEQLETRLDDFTKAAKEESDEVNKTITLLEAQLKVALDQKKQLETENSKLKEKVQLAEDEERAAQAEKLRQEIYLGQAAHQASAAPTDKICYLTFDDGPSDNTLKILGILKKYNIKATFFVVGDAKLDYLDRIHKEGHTIGLHSYTHDYKKIYASETAFLKDMKKISDAVKKRTGVTSQVIRFPGGSSNMVSLTKGKSKGLMKKLTAEMPKLGYSYFDWNVDSTDAAANKQPKTKIVNSVLKGAANKQSVCVLMHDLGINTTTVDALPSIITGLYKKGYRFEALTPESYGFHHSVRN